MPSGQKSIGTHGMNKNPSEYEFDWFKSYDELAPLFEKLLKSNDTILMLGCGNSVCIFQGYANS